MWDYALPGRQNLSVVTCLGFFEEFFAQCYLTVSILLAIGGPRRNEAHDNSSGKCELHGKLFESTSGMGDKYIPILLSIVLISLEL